MKAIHYPSLFKYARQSMGLNQREMAERLLVHQSTISKIESGRHCPHRGTMMGLARLTGLSMHLLTQRAAHHTRQQESNKTTPANRPAIRFKPADLQVARFRQSELRNKLKATLYLKEKALQKLQAQRYMHDLAETNALQILSEAQEITSHLQQNNAPPALLATARKTQHEAASHLALLRKKAIRIPPGYKLLLMEAEVRQLKARIEVLSINN
ncbi:helix-turn-helix domain-containing protein [Roseivirga sp. BDSF3-8]|uniref:helix-turn-helix domain-containing protein n=1 Tax=Roseivirga sp. BDSF3-8 TaxID=3241598 RepID=UPI003531DD5E